MAEAYESMIALEGESFALTSADQSVSVPLRGMYDRRTTFGELVGNEVRVADYIVGVPTSDLPEWTSTGCRIDIRSDTLHVTAVEPDGQGLTHLVCRPAL